jgi:hypothetical protein
MKILTRQEIKQLTGVLDPASQVAVLRRHGLNPFICPRSGRPLISDVAVNQVLVRQSAGEFVGNMEAFK